MRSKVRSNLNRRVWIGEVGCIRVCLLYKDQQSVLHTRTLIFPILKQDLSRLASLKTL